VPSASATFNSLRCGDPFPWVGQRTVGTPYFAVETMAGRYIVMCFFGSLADVSGRSALEAVQKHRDIFDDNRACFFGVSVDPQDEAQQRFTEMPGIRILWDFDATVSKACGAVPADSGSAAGSKVFRRSWIVADPTLHVLAAFSFQGGEEAHDRVFDFLRRLPAPAKYGGFEIPAPVLVLPHVLEPDLCRHLIEAYDTAGGTETGIVWNGAVMLDGSFKRRKDYEISDGRMCDALRQRIIRRIVPQIRTLFFMEITRIERFIVGCYAAEDGGHFYPHRDNNPGPTAHRRFAVSINLNDDFEGGAVQFPEYNLRGLKAPTGWAVVFPCAILHAVSKVTSGRRYTFLPFVYDENGARIKETRLRRAAEDQKAADIGDR
jgi:peroxiredoxin/predicted 2-oxoglutarate/Fe(II)-dependent dioxygenase YbiX